MPARAPNHIPKDWLHWQLADSAFPSGGFAHSGGLEAAYQQGECGNREHFIEFLNAAMAQTGTASLPLVSAGFDGAPPFSEVDGICDAFTSNHVANRASRRQGQAFLSSVDRALPHPDLAKLRRQIAAGELFGHAAPVFGAASRALELERDTALRLFLFLQIRGWISGAVRLGIVGALEAQGIQAEAAAGAERTIQRCQEYTLDDLAQTAPLLEILQGGQDRLYSRLFQS
jgi:urease accessory protein